MNVIEESEVQKYINDDEWVGQMKFDGVRRMIKSEGDTSIKPVGLNKKGIVIQLSEIINDAIVYFKCIIDGESVGEKVYIFDILSNNGKDLTNIPLVERLKVLDSLHFGTALEVVKTAYTKEEKQKMYDELVKSNAEGIVFKRKDGKYAAGRPNSGGNQVKFKFIKEASFIVKDHTKSKRSIGLELIDTNGNRIFMGKCSVPTNKKLPEIGAVVEVKYLYAYLGGAIAQPVFKEERTDVDVEECLMSQIIYKQGQEETED